MSVSDVVQNTDLSVWAEAALVLFLAAFLVVAARALTVDKDKAQRMASIPLDLEDERDDRDGADGPAAKKQEKGAR